MRDSDRTTMGGGNEGFETTKWSQIRDAQDRSQSHRREITNKLLKRYWKPVYCYLRRKGYNNEDAKDLTQGFFHEIVVGRDLIKRSSQAKGRFRAFLLAALDRYVIDVHRRHTAKKRAPEGYRTQLEMEDLGNLASSETGKAPEHVFNYAWVANLLDEVVLQVRDECHSLGMEAHWEAFRAKVLAPIFECVDTPPLKEICTAHGISSESIASNMIVTVKRRFRAAVMDSLCQFASSDSEAREEYNEMIKILLKKPAG